MGHEPIPLRGPRWAGVTTFAVVAMTLGGLVAVPIVFAAMNLGYGLERDLMVPVLLSTGSLTWFGVRQAFRWQSDVGAILWCICGCIALGALNVGVALAFHALFAKGGIGDAFVGLIFGTIAGATLGGPAGFVYGLVFLPPVVFLRRLNVRKAHDAHEIALLLSSMWLLPIGVLCTATASGDIKLIGLIGAGVAAVGMLTGLALSLRRRRWLLRVQRGAISGWALVPRADEEAETLRPFLNRPADDCALWLVRRNDQESPYRTHAIGTAVAVV